MECFNRKKPDDRRQPPIAVNSLQRRMCRGAKRGWLLHSLLLLMLLILAACGGSNPPPTKVTNTPTQPANVKPPASADAAMLDMLKNIQQNGFNPAANKGSGGLWINWRYGTSPLQVNLNDTGDPDTSDMPMRHDVLTDLRGVHAIWIYKNQHPDDTRFDTDLKRYTAIVKGEASAFQNNDRGWVYDELIDIAALSKDDFYKQSAQSLATYFYTTLYHPQTGMMYKVDAKHPQGYYRVDLVLEAACALIQGSITFTNPQWKIAGEQVIKNLYATAYVRDYHIFLNQMTNVLLPDGTLNPNPDIFRGLVGGTNIEGGQLRMGAAAQEMLSLLHVYSVTKDQTFLSRATETLGQLTSDTNALGLWDAKHAGYYNAFIFPGPNMQHLGTPKVSQGLKEAGRQLQMLEAFALANVFTSGKYQNMQNALLDVALNKAYYAPGHGVTYEKAPDWQIITLKTGKPADWVTTEAMGIAIESLAATFRSNPW